MDFSGFIVQFLNGLAEASSLFLVAAGLSLIFKWGRLPAIQDAVVSGADWLGTTRQSP